MSLLSESAQAEQSAVLAGEPDGAISAVRTVALQAKSAAVTLANATRAVKDAALEAMADALLASSAELLAANERDVQAAVANGTPAAMIDRLTLTPARIEAMAGGLRQVAGLPDPVGEVVRGSTLANGLEIRQVRVPFGVVGIVYEARPNVTVDAAGLCLKSGNVALLRGSGSAYHSNTALVAVLRAAAESVGLPAEIVNLVPGVDHDSVKALLRLRGIVDLIIPARRRRAHPHRRRGIDRAGHRDRRRQLPHLRRRGRRPGDGAAHRAQREDLAAERVQCRRDGARPPRHRARLPEPSAAGAERGAGHRARRSGGAGVRSPR